ncbi:hypothetical protein TKK_0008371 [Trichogramma kaykai]
MVHVEKIVPSLLYNMQNSRYSNEDNTTPESPTEERSDPPQFAETYNHQLWVPNYFAIHTFRMFMFSIQFQYSYTCRKKKCKKLYKKKAKNSAKYFAENSGNLQIIFNDDVKNLLFKIV